MAAVKFNGKYGYIDQTGKFVIEPQYDDADTFCEDELARIQLDGKYGCIDKSGKIIIKPQYEWLTIDNKNVIFIKQGEKWGMVDRNGDYVVKPKFDWVIDRWVLY